MDIEPEGPSGRSIGRHKMEGKFSIAFQSDRIHNAMHKVTHLHEFGDKDALSQDVPGICLLNTEKRGKKLYTGGIKINGDYYIVSVFEIGAGDSYRFIATNSEDDSNLFLHLSSMEVQSAVLSVAPTRSETLFNYLYQSEENTGLKKDVGVKDTSNPRWLLRRTQRNALSFVLSTMLRVRKPVNANRVLVLDPHDGAVVFERERVAIARSKVGSIRVTLLKECFALLGGYALIRAYEQQEPASHPHLTISVYSPH